MLCYFLLYNEVNQLCVYIYPLPLGPPCHLTPPHPTHLGHHRAPSWAPWAIQQVPTSYLFYTWPCTYVNPNLPIHHTLHSPQPPCPHLGPKSFSYTVMRSSPSNRSFSSPGRNEHFSLCWESEHLQTAHLGGYLVSGARSLAGLLAALIESWVVWDDEERCEKMILKHSQKVLASLFKIFLTSD